MQIFIYCKVTQHVLGVTAPIIRSTKNCNRSLRYRSYYWYSYFPPTWPIRKMAAGISSEMISAQVSERTVSDKKHVVCDCEKMIELNEVK